MFRYGLLIIFIFLLQMVTAQPKTDSFLLQLLQENGDANFQQVLQSPGRYRLQVIYTRINRDRQNNPTFTNFYFHYDPALYFNPASMVKMPAAFLALEKLHKLNRKGLDKYTTIQYEQSQPWQKPLVNDTTAFDGRPSIAHLIKRAFLVSENDPYNRLYQFVGQGDFNRVLHQKGYTDLRITRQFMGLTPEQNRYTNGIRFLDKKGKMIYAQEPAFNLDSFDFSRVIKIGNAHLDRNNKLVNEPFDFTQHNAISLGSMQQMLQSVMFPQSVPREQRFSLGKDDYAFLYRYLSQYPSETPDPKYDAETFYDSYVKFFFRDSTHRMPPGVRVFNKVGWAYGFLTDVAYVADFHKGVEFMLAATLYVNSNNILNDSTYDYETVGWPFLYQLGQTVYRYELGRDRRYKPDLSRFRVAYEQRNPADKRPVLKEVDN
jgi:hypothetical protein